VDVNDHRPEFVNGAPYKIVLDENTRPGLPVFRGIAAIDRDQPGSPNSDISYAISQQNVFSLESSSAASAVLILRRPLDYERGDRLFNLTLTAQVSVKRAAIYDSPRARKSAHVIDRSDTFARMQDHGLPPLTSTTYVLVEVRDGDDQGPAFTRPTYTASVDEDLSSSTVSSLSDAKRSSPVSVSGAVVVAAVVVVSVGITSR